MRRILLAGAALAAVSLIHPEPAHALFGVGDVVIDPTAVANQVRQLANEAKSLANQAKDQLSWLQQAKDMATTIQQGYQIGNALVHTNNLGAVVNDLQMLGIQNPLPVNAWAVQQLMTGQPNVGSIGTLGNLFNTNYNANSIYLPSDGSIISRIMGQSARGVAGAQSAAQKLYDSMATRQSNMGALQAKLAASTDIKETADIQAQLTMLQNDIGAQAVQAQALSMMQRAAEDNERNQIAQQRQKEIDDLLADAAAHGFN